MRQFNVIMGNAGRVSMKEMIISEKRQAFLHMEELKKKYPFPKDYNYEQVRRAAVEEKYGRVN